VKFRTVAEYKQLLNSLIAQANRQKAVYMLSERQSDLQKLLQIEEKIKYLFKYPNLPANLVTLDEYREASQIVLPESEIVIPDAEVLRHFKLHNQPLGPQLCLDPEFVSFKHTIPNKSGKDKYSVFDIEGEAYAKLKYVKSMNLQQLIATGSLAKQDGNGKMKNYSEFTLAEREEFNQQFTEEIESRSDALTRLHACTASIIDARLRCTDENGKVSAEWMDKL